MSASKIVINVSEVTLEDTTGPLIGELHLRLSAGEVTTLLGPSGSGKTTLLRIIAGLEPRFPSTVLIDGSSVTRPCRCIELVFSDYHLLPWRTARQNIEFGASVAGADDVESSINQLLESFDISARADAWPSKLSAGEQARVALAQAMMEPPDLLLLDEPFKSLDFPNREKMAKALLSWIRAHEVPTLLVGHSVADAVNMSDRVIILKAAPLKQVGELSLKDLRSGRDLNDERIEEKIHDLKVLMREHWTRSDAREHDSPDPRA